MALSERIKALRKARGLTRDDLAARIGVTGAYLSMLESGKRANPTRDVLHKLAAALGVAVAELEGEPDLLAGPFPADQLRQEGLGEDYLRRYQRLWGHLSREQRAWLIGHLRIVADAERRVQALERAAEDDPPGSPAPAGAEAPPVLAHVVFQQ